MWESVEEPDPRQTCSWNKLLGYPPPHHRRQKEPILPLTALWDLGSHLTSLNLNFLIWKITLKETKDRKASISVPGMYRQCLSGCSCCFFFTAVTSHWNFFQQRHKSPSESSGLCCFSLAYSNSTSLIHLIQKGKFQLEISNMLICKLQVSKGISPPHPGSVAG